MTFEKPSKQPVKLSELCLRFQARTSLAHCNTQRTQIEDMINLFQSSERALKEANVGLLYFAGLVQDGMWLKEFADDLSTLGFDSFVMLRDLGVPISGQSSPPIPPFCVCC